MRTNKTIKIRRPDVRSLKIQPKTRYNKYSQKDVPEIKLYYAPLHAPFHYGGDWLLNLGFESGAR